MFDPTTADFSYSGPIGPDPSSDSIYPIVFDDQPGATITSDGPILNNPGIGPAAAPPASDPNSVGGILNGLANVAGSIAKITGSLNAPGSVPRPIARPASSVGVGINSGIAGVSLPMLLLIGGGIWFFLRKKAA